jgi:hypothetical protein
MPVDELFETFHQQVSLYDYSLRFTTYIRATWLFTLSANADKWL